MSRVGVVYNLSKLILKLVNTLMLPAKVQMFRSSELFLSKAEQRERERVSEAVYPSQLQFCCPGNGQGEEAKESQSKDSAEEQGREGVQRP